ncbi:FMN-binding protein [Candidatus Stoquefichus sp. SB1]|jgi:uncharacterized protein with FMN-binding domain|uniref:FMN-binding protein n=1 Tax=Candidatus Stoquefichus sp. SB1 TaxID=1658109 RepID=UPI00067EA575|nr:FMN-binding protein [Candidatus Stoquefichus sp. SB1]
MKKITTLFLVIMLCGCSQQKKQEESKKTIYKDGTYTTSAIGYGGEFQVETTIKDDKIEDIVVKEHNETPSIGGVAVEQMITSMKKENKYDVDTISGATKTSQALKEAVKEAMEKAKNTSK